VIQSFVQKGLKSFYETDSAAGIQSGNRKKLRLQIVALDTAHTIDDMDIPGFRLHSLKGKRKNLWAINVSGNWRMIFQFEEGNASLVNYEDYH